MNFSVLNSSSTENPFVQPIEYQGLGGGGGVTALKSPPTPYIGWDDPVFHPYKILLF